MLKKANRLRSQRDFKRTLAGRRLCVNDCFTVYGLAFASSATGATGPFSAAATALPHPSPATTQLRVGFIVSKKIHKKSAHRNRIKRRLREIVRLWLLSDSHRARLAGYRSLVLIARSGSLNASYRTLESRMEQCFRSR